jgi:multicomponent Na+:H+ antiporter subunit E
MERFVLSVLTWVALWGEVNLANVATGFVVSIALWLAFPPSRRVDHRLNLGGTVRFLGRFVVDLVTSSLAVAVAVLRPTPRRLEVKVVDVALGTSDPLLMTIICNAMTLTPGTMTVAVNESTSTLRLHVLGEIDAATVQQHVHHLEARVADAVRCVPRREGGRWRRR